MRQPTDQETKDYRYITTLAIDVKRTDNAMLTDEENKMVDEMKTAAEQAIAKVMTDHGNTNRKHLGSEKRIY